MITLHYDEAYGKTYEATYTGWLEIFRVVAENDCADVKDAPQTWHPLLWYLGAGGYYSGYMGWTREAVEASCALEPVLVDALWRADMKWSGNRRHKWESSFKIATYSGFWRPEILAHLKKLRRHEPTKDRCIVVPCAADKPYPSPLHKAVREVVGDSYEIIVGTSALGLVPEAMWPDMPCYDAGLPYFERVQEVACEYFGDRRKHYSSIVVYSDMLQWDLVEGINQSASGAQLITPIYAPRRCDYMPLMEKENLDRLRRAIHYEH